MTNKYGMASERIVAPETSDEDALREYGRQLAMDSLMVEFVLDAKASDRFANIVALGKRGWRPRVWISAAALEAFARTCLETATQRMPSRVRLV